MTVSKGEYGIEVSAFEDENDTVFGSAYIWLNGTGKEGITLCFVNHGALWFIEKIYYNPHDNDTFDSVIEVAKNLGVELHEDAIKKSKNE